VAFSLTSLYDARSNAQAMDSWSTGRNSGLMSSSKLTLSSAAGNSDSLGSALASKAFVLKVQEQVARSRPGVASWLASTPDVPFCARPWLMMPRVRCVVRCVLLKRWLDPLALLLPGGRRGRLSRE
jgi:hypothetical protein